MKKGFLRVMGCVLAVTLITSAVPSSVWARGPGDIAGHWAQADIELLMERGIVRGDSPGHIRPDSPITRAEFAAVVNRAFQLNGADGNNPGENLTENFPDVKPGSWYFADMAAAKKAGYLLGGANGNAGPERAITRAEAVTILQRILKLPEGDAAQTFADQGAFPDWSLSGIKALSGLGVIKGYPDGNFRPDNSITRAEAFALIARLIRLGYIGGAKTVDSGKTPAASPGNAGGNVSIGTYASGGDNTGGNTGNNTGNNTGGNTGGNNGGNGGNTGGNGGNTGGNGGGNTGGIGGNTGGNTGGNGGNTGDNGGNTGDNTGGNTGDNGGNTGDNGGNTGDNGGNTGDNGGNTGGNGDNTGGDAAPMYAILSVDRTIYSAAQGRPLSFTLLTNVTPGDGVSVTLCGCGLAYNADNTAIPDSDFAFVCDFTYDAAAGIYAADVSGQDKWSQYYALVAVGKSAQLQSNRVNVMAAGDYETPALSADKTSCVGGEKTAVTFTLDHPPYNDQVFLRNSGDRYYAQMFDDGGPASGDQTAGDGIYSCVLNIDELDAAELVFQAYFYYDDSEEGYYDKSAPLTFTVAANPFHLVSVSGDVAVEPDSTQDKGFYLELTADGAYAEGNPFIELTCVSDDGTRYPYMTPRDGGGWYYQEYYATYNPTKYTYTAQAIYNDGRVINSKPVTVVACTREDYDSVNRMEALLDRINQKQTEIFDQTGWDGFAAPITAYMQGLEDAGEITDLTVDNDQGTLTFTTVDGGAGCIMSLRKQPDGVLSAGSAALAASAEDTASMTSLPPPPAAMSAAYVPVTDIKVNPDSTVIPPGFRVQLYVTIYPIDATNPSVTWSSDDTSVATVDPQTGVVTALKVGFATITAYSDDNGAISANCGVTVSPLMSSGDPNIIHDNRAVFISSFWVKNPLFAPHNVPRFMGLYESVRQAKNVFSQVRYIGNAVNLDDFKQISGYGAVYIFTHGSLYNGKVLICTAVLENKQDDAYYIEKSKKYKNSDLIEIGIANPDEVNNGIPRINNYCLTPDFIRKYCIFPNSMIFADFCDGAANATMWNAFQTMGARAYNGFDGIVDSGYALDITTTMTQEMIEHGVAAYGAYTTAINKYGTYDPNAKYDYNTTTKPVLYGNHDLKFWNNPDDGLQNGSFEDGFDYWTYSGKNMYIDTRASIDNGYSSPSISPSDGALLAYFGPDNNATLSQKFSLHPDTPPPPGVKPKATLKFDYAWLYGGHTNWPTGGVEVLGHIITKDYTDWWPPTPMSEAYIDVSVSSEKMPATPPKRLPSSILNDGWKTCEIDLTQYQGHDVTLKLWITADDNTAIRNMYIDSYTPGEGAYNSSGTFYFNDATRAVLDNFRIEWENPALSRQGRPRAF